MAGKRKGKDDERYLWGEMLRAIQEIKPKYVIAENVFGITNIDGGLVFEQVCLDLETEGYEVQPFIIGAVSKNAPHRRDRVWFVAQNTLFSGCIHGETNEKGAEIREFGNISTRSADGIYLSKRDASNTNSNGFNERNGNDEINTSQGGEYALNDIEQISIDTECIGRTEIRNDNGQFETPQQSERREQQFSGADSTQIWWRNFPSQSPVCGGDDGIPTQLDGITFSKWRAESIKGYGNAIVPQVAFELFKVIEELNKIL
jgi:DNA (cytosine-5)-methyltransferase 1